MKSFATKYGRFSDDGMEYIVTTPRTPRPWINVISNGDYGITVSQTGSGYSWRTHAQSNVHGANQFIGFCRLDDISLRAGR